MSRTVRFADEQHALVSDSDDDSTIAGSIDSEKGAHQNFTSRRITSCQSHSHKRSHRWQSRLTWIRWSIVLLLQCTILTLTLVRTTSPRTSQEIVGETHAGGDINGLYHEAPRQYRPLTFQEALYMPNMTTNDNREEVRQRWNKLLPLGSGSIAIKDWKSHPLLGEPITDDPVRSGPIYEASWTHSLHCLYYSVDTYHQLVVNGPTGNENHHHSAHCFEYLRQSLLCNLDMTLEGSYSAHGASGGQMHMCRDRDHAVKWIEQRRLDDLQDIVGP